MKTIVCSKKVLRNGVATLLPAGTGAARVIPAIALLVLCSGPLARAAALTITPTFDSTITSDPNAATIEAAINATIARVTADLTAPNADNVTITFQETSSGLGSSSTLSYSVPYSTYRGLLLGNATPSANDTTADATLPSGTNNPVNGTANVNVGTSLARALGYANYTGGPDGTISLNTSIMNLSRTGGQNNSFYDLQAVAGHEIDEVLGIGGPGSALTKGGSTTGNIGTLDLFRYSAAGVRSFTDAAGPNPYFSINGGTTNIVYFNQVGASDGADMSDWGNPGGTASGNSPAQLQDAYGTPGVDVNIGTSELTALDVIGYNLAAAPEPTPAVLIFGGLLLGVGVMRRRPVKRLPC